MTTRKYSATAQPTTLAADCTDSATTIQVSATTGFPAVDFTLALDFGAAGQEIVLVTNVSGTTLTVTRGYNSTSASAHSLGAVVQHVHTAQDFTDSRNHEAASSGVHGISGSVVGTTDTQALSNKDLSSGNTFPSTLATKTGTETLTHKDLTDATNSFPSSLATDAEVTSAIGTHASATATHGATGAVVGTTNTQTLTNKTIDLASNTVTMTKAQLNAAVSDADVATLAGTETLTNKTLTAPVTTGLTGDTGVFSGNVTAANLPTAIKIGAGSVTFDSNGVATITHGLGSIPSYFQINHQIAQGGDIISIAPRVSSATTTTIIVEARKHDGTIYASASLSAVRWLAAV